MTRPVSWQVCVSPEVEGVLIAVSRRHPSGRFTSAYFGGLDRLARSGTRATGVKKLRSLDLWEIRVGDYRAFFCPMQNTNQLALGALEVKKAGRFRMEKLRVIERKVHEWGDTLETNHEWQELKDELDAIPGVRESLDRHYPYHELSLEIGGVRADLDMTQTEFGRLVGIPQSTVARLESGQQNPSVGMLQRIAKATGTELVIEFKPQKRELRRAKRRKTETSSTTRPGRAESIAASNRTRR